MRSKLMMGWVVAAIGLIGNAPAVGQLDRARDAPYSDWKRSYEETLRYAGDNNRDKAFEWASNHQEHSKALLTFSADAREQVGNGNLRDLQSRAQAFVSALGSHRERTAQLGDRVKRVSDSFSSELSSFRGSWDEANRRFNDAWTDFQRSGAALKSTGATLADVRNSYASDWKRYFEETLRYASENNRDRAHEAATRMQEKTQEFYKAAYNTSSPLDSVNLRDLVSKAQSSVNAMKSLHERTAQLGERFKRVGDSYSSELTSMLSAYYDARRVFDEFAAEHAKASQALRAACAACMR